MGDMIFKKVLKIWTFLLPLSLSRSPEGEHLSSPLPIMHDLLAHSGSRNNRATQLS